MIEIYKNYYYRRERQNEKSKYYCLYCEKVYKCRASVRTHYNRHHKKRTYKNTNKVNPIQNIEENNTKYPINLVNTNESSSPYYNTTPIKFLVAPEPVERPAENPLVNKPKKRSCIDIIEQPRFSDYDFLLKVIQQNISYIERDERKKFEFICEQERKKFEFMCEQQRKEKERQDWEYYKNINWLHEYVEKIRNENRRERNRQIVKILKSYYMEEYPKEKN